MRSLRAACARGTLTRTNRTGTLPDSRPVPPISLRGCRVSAEVVIDGNALRVELSGLTGKLSMKSQLEVPIADVIGVRVATVDDAREGQPLKELWPVVG